MPFNIADIYTTSGSASLFNSWTTPVTKFDPSSFYNWEQDNEPIHDLEERTYMNWEHAGYHTSTVPGMVLTVSAEAPPATLTANPNIFTTVSAAVEAIPSDIRFPILMEVANFGDLGHIKLKDIKIGYGGSLEIINRNFVRSYAVSGGAVDESDTCRIHKLSTGEQSQYKMINAVSSLDSSTIWAETSAVHLGQTVLSGSLENRLNLNINSIFQPFTSGQGNSRLSVSINGSPSAGVNCFELSPFEYTAAADTDPHNILGYDVSAKDLLQDNQPELLINKGIAIDNKAQGMMYGNYAKGIEVTNCNGPIYIRNFFVNSGDHYADGVSVFNSNDLWLENCASINNKVGFNLVNSKVFVNRGIAAYRNYGVDASNKRKTGAWLGASATHRNPFSDDGAGLKAANSEIVFNTASSIYSRQGSDQTSLGAFDYEVYPKEFLINFSRNSFGLKLDNSVLRGGWAGDSSYYLSSFDFNVELSDECGIHSRNSTIDLDGRLKVYSNNIGILLEDSKAIVNECVIMGNQHEGIHAINSNIQYNRNLQKLVANTASNDEYQFDFSGNGRHLVLDQGSSFVPTVASAMPSRYGQMRFLNHHGISTSGLGETARILPPVVVQNNSNATLVHPIIKSFSCHTQLKTNIASGVPMAGECLSVVNNSKVLLQGSMNGATVIYGSTEGFTNGDSYTAHKHSAGIHVSNNSQIECNGPTVLFNFGVDILAKNNSIINFNPHKKYDSDVLDTSGWDLADAKNHTSVELHSTNTCLVAKDNSTINMKDLGDYHACWTAVNASSPDYDTGLGGFNTSAYTSGGSMQFYPNPIGVPYYAGAVGVATEPAGLITQDMGGGHKASFTFGTVNNTGSNGDQHPRNYYLEDNPFKDASHFDVSSTAGGSCLRAMGGSHVNVLNTNFPAGWWNASGLIYDVSGAEKGSGTTLCNRMFIWNIADNSRLHAAFCSVSGLDPRSVGYNGPSSTYENAANGVGAYYAPSNTPDTSTLSIIDFYGQSPNSNTANLPIPQFSSLAVSNTTYMDHQLASGAPGVPLTFRQYGTTPPSLENRGPFRLYVSVDPMVNFFSGIDPSTKAVMSDDGFARQIYAQGYNLSGDVSAGPADLSAVYGNSILDLSKHSVTDGSALSGFVYNNQVVDPTTHNRILLDESAAHTFANAKNGAMGTSNRSKICKIYVSRKQYRGEAAALSDEKSYGRGYTSPDVFDLERKE